MVWQCYPVIANKEILDMQHHHQRMNSQETRQPGITQGSHTEDMLTDEKTERWGPSAIINKEGEWQLVDE